MANLTEQERAQLKAAHDKATQQNPALEEAMKAARQTMEKARKDLHDAMIAIDPSVAPILGKIEPPKWERKGNGPHGEPGKGGDGREGRRHATPPGMANLTEQERAQLKTAHEQIKSDPSVAAAREALKTATTPEARHAAHESLRQAADAALLKVDPSLGPILEKLHQAGPPPAPSSSSSSNSTKEGAMPPAQ
jgi:Spy/CpxP family protein refolding chaperone